MPQEILDSLLSFKDDDEAVRQFGISYCSEMCRHLLNSEFVCGLHFYTMNREFATVQILKNLGLWNDSIRRSLPWKTSANPVRCMEEVRPIFWSSRPQSYIYRTSDWDEFPNGRWTIKLASLCLYWNFMSIKVVTAFHFVVDNNIIIVLLIIIIIIIILLIF